MPADAGAGPTAADATEPADVGQDVRASAPPPDSARSGPRRPDAANADSPQQKRRSANKRRASGVPGIGGGGRGSGGRRHTDGFARTMRRQRGRSRALDAPGRPRKSIERQTARASNRAAIKYAALSYFPCAFSDSIIFSSDPSEKPSEYALGMTTVPPEPFTLS